MSLFGQGTDFSVSLCPRNQTIPRVVILKFQKMGTKILKVVRQGETFDVNSRSSETGKTRKCTIVLREPGSGDFGNTFACDILGSQADCRFAVGDLVAATLAFSVHEHEGHAYQDVMCRDIVKI